MWGFFHRRAVYFGEQLEIAADGYVTTVVMTPSTPISAGR
jgi:hypothetical protein